MKQIKLSPLDWAVNKMACKLLMPKKEFMKKKDQLYGDLDKLAEIFQADKKVIEMRLKILHEDGE